jgi:hypothetical protein
MAMRSLRGLVLVWVIGFFICHTFGAAVCNLVGAKMDNLSPGVPARPRAVFTEGEGRVWVHDQPLTPPAATIGGGTVYRVASLGRGTTILELEPAAEAVVEGPDVCRMPSNQWSGL